MHEEALVGEAAARAVGLDEGRGNVVQGALVGTTAPPPRVAAQLSVRPGYPRRAPTAAPPAPPQLECGSRLASTSSPTTTTGSNTWRGAPSSPPPDPASRTPDPTCGGPRRARRGGAGAELTAAGSGLASAGSKLGRQAPPARVSAWRRRTRPRRPRIWASPARAGERMESPGRRRRAEPNRYLPSGRCTRAAAPSFSIASPRPQR